MKLALTATALAAGMLAIGMSMSPANAATGSHKWCVHKPHQATIQCRYDTLAACNKFARPTSGTCSINPKWASLNKKSTTGMKPMEK